MCENTSKAKQSKRCGNFFKTILEWDGFELYEFCEIQGGFFFLSYLIHLVGTGVSLKKNPELNPSKDKEFLLRKSKNCKKIMCHIKNFSGNF